VVCKGWATTKEKAKGKKDQGKTVPREVKSSKSRKSEQEGDSRKKKLPEGGDHEKKGQRLCIGARPAKPRSRVQQRGSRSPRRETCRRDVREEKLKSIKKKTRKKELLLKKEGARCGKRKKWTDPTT